MKTPLDNLKNILSKADALAESGFSQENQEKKNEEDLATVPPHFETAAPTEKSPNYSENIKRLDEILKAYRAKKISFPSEAVSK